LEIGVLALQGGVAPHLETLSRVGHHAREVRRAHELDDVDGLVLPGGESTTHLRLIARSRLREPLDAFVRSGRPVLATCAGLVLAATKATSPDQESYGWLDVDVERNGWGRQVRSSVETADDGRTTLVLIRAPRITRVGPDVVVLLRFRGEPVLVRQGNVTAATFHPELGVSLSIHREAFAPRGPLAGRRGEPVDSAAGGEVAARHG
jgi:5'-phosphate synthase pdxT subunit